MGTGQAEGVESGVQESPPQKDTDPVPGTHGACTQDTKLLLFFNSPFCPGQEKNFLFETLTRFFNILGRKGQSSARLSTPLPGTQSPPPPWQPLSFPCLLSLPGTSEPPRCTLTAAGLTVSINPPPFLSLDLIRSY